MLEALVPSMVRRLLAASFGTPSKASDKTSRSSPWEAPAFHIAPFTRSAGR
jgi:hypothetical protein